MIEKLISKWKDMYVVNKGREWMRKDFIKDLESLQSTEQEWVEIKNYFIVNDIGDDMERLSVRFDNFEEALNFLNSSYEKAVHPYAYIVWGIK